MPRLKWVGLMALALSVGVNLYLWHLWRQDQAVTQVVAQFRQELQALQTQVQELQRLKMMVDQSTGDVRSLQKAAADDRIEMEALKVEIKRLQDSRVSDAALLQKQLQTYREQLTRQRENQPRNEVNW